MTAESEKPFPIFSIEETDEFLKDVLRGLEIENPADIRSLDIILNQKGGGLSKNQRVWMHTLMDRDGKRFPLD